MADFRDNGDGEDRVPIQLDDESDDPLPADRWEFVHVVHALVGAETEAGAIGTAIGAFTHLGIRNSRVDAHQLIEEFECSSDAYLTRRWGPLPDSTHLESGTGRRLVRLSLERIRERSEQSTDADDSVPAVPFLCTESGTGLDSHSAVTRYRRGADEPVWVVPAVTFHYLTSRSGPVGRG